ncbi:hypothetical protein [Roseococcus sp.]
MDLLPLGLTCVLTLSAWIAALLREPWAAELDEAASEEMEEAWFLL